MTFHTDRTASDCNRPLIIFGCGEIADVVHFYFIHDAGRPIAAFTVDASHLRESNHQGLPVVPFERLEVEFPPARYDLFVAIGYRQLNRLRAEKCRLARAKGYRLASYVSSRATLWPDFSCGDNCLILEDNTIQPYVRIGNNVVLWSGNHIGHHASLGDDAFITSHVVIAGGVKVGRRCFLGVNSSTHDHIEIGDDCVIGAGAIVAGSLPAGSVLTPASSRTAPFGSDRLRGVFSRHAATDDPKEPR